jgi:release factor glutamine methyltransferase
LLVELALDWCKQHARERYELLDLGTGSGCIAITIAKRQPGVRAVATDVSASALEVAARNAELHAVADRVRLVQADMLEVPAEAVPPGGFDVIVSNPPYIAETERDALPANVRDHEPAVALFGGSDGLHSYRRISAGVHRLLRPGGMLAMEVGYEQAAAVEAVFAAGSPALQLLGRHRDLAGIDRAVQFTLPA